MNVPPIGLTACFSLMIDLVGIISNYKRYKMWSLIIAGILTSIICSAAAANSTVSVYVTGEENISGVRAVIEDGSVFISLDDISEKLGIISKDIGEGMVGLCKGDLCVPVQLDNEEDARRDSGVLMINADLIAATLDSRAEWLVMGRALRFIPVDNVMPDEALKVGDVVPDFLLPSIADGKMVSFSRFRGKRVLLFLWASW